MKGAKINIPKSIAFDRYVCGQSESSFSSPLLKFVLILFSHSPHGLVAQGVRHP